MMRGRLSNGVREIDGLHVAIGGRTDADAPTILFVSGLGGLGAYWAPQLASLAGEFRLVTYDQRGTGASANAHATLGSDYTVAALARDAASIITGLDLGRVHLVGHALGGLAGLQLALDRPELIDRLIPVNAWARIDAHTQRCFDCRLMLLRAGGPAAYLKAQPIFLFPSSWLSENADRLAIEEAHALAHFPAIPDLLARIAAITRFDVEARLVEIGHRTLLVATRDDVLVPFTRSSAAASAMPNARLAILQHGGHAVNVTEAKDFENLLLDFLQAPA